VPTGCALSFSFLSRMWLFQFVCYCSVGKLATPTNLFVTNLLLLSIKAGDFLKKNCERHVLTWLSFLWKKKSMCTQHVCSFFRKEKRRADWAGTRNAAVPAPSDTSRVSTRSPQPTQRANQRACRERPRERERTSEPGQLSERAAESPRHRWPCPP